MRYAFWLAVIVFSISALAGGFFSGRAAVPHFPKAASTPQPQASPLAPGALGVPQTDVVARDAFAQDAAVAAQAPAGSERDDAALALVIVDAGRSVALESPFLSLGVPVTLVVDPNAPAASAMTQLAARSGTHVYVQARAPLTRAQIDALHAQFPHARGLAARLVDASDAGAPARRALHRLGWGVLDEYGENARWVREFRAGGVPYRARSITVDDHLERSYVGFMLREAVHLGRGGTSVVIARPFPGTLQAFEDLLARTSRDGVRFVQLP